MRSTTCNYLLILNFNAFWLSTVNVFIEDQDCCVLGKAYNDDALFNFHMMTQQQKIRDYTASDYYIDTKSLWNLAWHDAFVRNGLSDFVPPLTDNLNVLVVGESSDTEVGLWD